MVTQGRIAAVSAAACFVVTAGCAAANKPVGAEHKGVAVARAIAIGSDDGGSATYSVVASSRANGVARYRLASPRTHAAALELFVREAPGRAYADVITSGKRDLAIAPGGVVLRAVGHGGVDEERAFLRSMRSPVPAKPLRSSVEFTSALLAEHDTGDATNATPSSVYKLFGMFPGGDDVELYLAVADDGRSARFSEKDDAFRPVLTRFFTR